MRRLIPLSAAPAEFLATATNLSSFAATGPHKAPYPVLKHLPRSGMNFLLQIFNLSWSLHFLISSMWKTSSVIRIHKTGKPLDSPASFRSISLTSCVSKLFEHIILCCLIFFLECNSILSPSQVQDGLLLIKICSFLSPFRMSLTNPSLLFESFRLCLAPRPFPRTYFG